MKKKKGNGATSSGAAAPPSPEGKAFGTDYRKALGECSGYDWRRLILILLGMIEEEEKLEKIYLMMNRIYGE